MLSPYRVLDLTDEKGHLAGATLAALGADVIAVEPPDGSAARRRGPFVDDVAGSDRSLTHLAYNRNKRSVVLDPSTRAGRDAFERLVAGSDVLIESGELGAFGLDAAAVQAAHPHLVVATLTGFGHDGPKADYAHTDLTLMASACTLAFTGDADRAPVRVTVPQGYHFAAAVATGGILVALHERAGSGLGQVVDVTAQGAILLGVQGGVLAAAVNAPVATRAAGGSKVGVVDLRFVYPCADGWVSISHVFGDAIGPGTARLMQWVHDAGFCEIDLVEKDWIRYAVLLESGEEPLENWERAKAAVEAACLAHTKAELVDIAMTRNLYLAPIASSKDVHESKQLAVRGFFADIELPSDPARRIPAPAFFAKVRGGAPLPRLGRAPRLGEHTDEVLTEATRVPAVGRPVGGTGGRPLDGLKVLDFSWSIAGPNHTRVLADAGATVVKIESLRRPDAARGFQPVYDNIATAETSALFDIMNAGKKSLGLNMSDPQGREVAQDLVRWADVVVESYTPKAMRKWELDYDHLRELNPSVVMLSTCLAGQDGPLANFAGFGNLGAALAGFYGLAGWPDRPPAGPYMAYTDYTSTHFMLATLLAALDHRRRTGEGCYIDLAQSEAATWFLAPALYDWAVNGRLVERAGNTDPQMSPHGVYPCAGDDNWVAVACRDDRDWQALAPLLDCPDLVAVTTPHRLDRNGELDALVAAWTATRDRYDVQHLLQSAAVPAHAVQSSRECLADPQLLHRGHFVELARPDRRCIVENSRFRLSRTPVGPEAPAPMIGEHTFEVLSELLGYDVDRIADLAAAEVLE